MSNMIPDETVSVMRQYVDISLDSFGIPITLYVPNNLTTVEIMDVYAKPSDYTYDVYTCLAFIEWSPNMYRLKALGLYVEDELPILVSLPNQCTNDSGVEVDVDILRDSYITVAMEYISSLYSPSDLEKVDEFDLTTPIVRNVHNAVIVKQWKAVPRRVK